MILASESPRRRELLGRLGIAFSIESAQVAEAGAGEGIPASRIPLVNAERKAEAVSMRHPEELVLGADTCIVFGDEIIGKPKDMDDARRILRHLAGREHQVVTGVALLRKKDGFRRVWSESSSVRFKPFGDDAMERYLALVPVLDKAGAYAIQEHGELIVEGFSGELENIIGLPLLRLKKELDEQKP